MVALHERELDEAKRRLEDAIRILIGVGDGWMVAIARNNLGNATRDLGDMTGARAAYRAALDKYREVGDRWAMAFIFEDIGLLAILVDQPLDGIAMLGAAETLRAETGSPRGEALEDELRFAYEPARQALGHEATDAALARGRALDLDAALTLADELCGAASTGGTTPDVWRREGTTSSGS
jgi:hypothetical protein